MLIFPLKMKRGLLVSFYETNITFCPNQTRYYKEKMPVSIMNINIKIFNKVLENQIQQYIRRVITLWPSGILSRNGRLYNIQVQLTSLTTLRNWKRETPHSSQ